MLSQVLQKIEAEDFDFSDKELKVAAAYSSLLLKKKPELLEQLALSIPEGMRIEAVAAWIRHMLVQTREKDSQDPIPAQFQWMEQEIRRIALKKAEQKYKDEGEETIAVEAKRIGDDALFSVLQSDDYMMLRAARQHNHLQGYLIDLVIELGGKESAGEMLRSGNFQVLGGVVYYGDAADLQQMFASVKEIGGDELLREIFYSHSGVYRLAPIFNRGDLAPAQELMEVAKELGVAKELIDSIGFASFMRCRVRNQEMAQKIVEWVEEFGSRETLSKIRFEQWQGDFIEACAEGQVARATNILEGLKTLLLPLTYPLATYVEHPAEVPLPFNYKLDTLYRKAFQMAARQGSSIEILRFLMQQVKESRGKVSVANMLVETMMLPNAYVTPWGEFGVDPIFTGAALYVDEIDWHMFGGEKNADKGDGKKKNIDRSQIIHSFFELASELEDQETFKKEMVKRLLKTFRNVCSAGDEKFAERLMIWVEENGGNALKAELLQGERKDYDPFNKAAINGHVIMVRRLMEWAKELGGDEPLNMLSASEFYAFRVPKGRNKTEIVEQLTAWAQELGGDALVAKMEASAPSRFLAANRTKGKTRNASTPSDEGNQRWLEIYRQEPPHPRLAPQSPFKFSGKVYEAMLPVVEAARRVERIFAISSSAIDAYKLAVLFANAQEAERYLDRFLTEWSTAENRQPVHDALLFDIPNEGQWNPDKWKDLVLKYGPAVSKYLGLAPKIEAYVAEHGLEFPQKPQDVFDLVVQVAYDRASEHPEFSAVALGCGLSEHNFNKGLEIIQQQSKTHENLPDIFIDGADIGHPNFYMEKLPPSDPIGLLLGKLTNCCQHIGGAGRKCALHGFSSVNSGFYVWKHKTKGQVTPNDTIVAQSWAWRGKDNALVFDSFERLGSAYDVLVQPFLEQFAHEVQGHHFTETKKLRAVRLGRGGNTPDLSYDKTETPSQPMGYDDYRDSHKQYDVPARQHRKEAEAEVLTPTWAGRETVRQAEQQRVVARR